MAFLKNAINSFGRTKTIGVISIISIIVISYGLFFYLQNATESNIRNSLFEQQKQRQLDSTKAISERISSDLDSIMSRLQGLANSVYLQQGDLSSNKTKKLMKEYYLPVSTNFTTDRLVILNTSDISVDALALKGEQIFKGVNFSYRDWVGQTKSTFMPVFSNGYEGRDGKYRIAITYPIVNRETGKYIGLVGSTNTYYTILSTLWKYLQYQFAIPCSLRPSIGPIDSSNTNICGNSIFWKLYARSYRIQYGSK